MNWLRRRIINAGRGAWALRSDATPIALVSTLLFGGCALDHRTMQLGPEAGGTAGGGTAPVGADGGQPVSSGTVHGPVPPVDIPVCVYDAGVEPGCETLVKNPDFSSAIDGWAPEDGTLPTWDPNNASTGDGSGSLRVWNRLHGLADGWAPGAARQCLPVTGGAIYDVAADVFIDEGQGEGVDKDVVYEGQAGITVFFHVVPNCGGPTERSFDSALTSEVGQWVHVDGSGRAPELAQSMIVRLNTLKPMREYTFLAKFDNVLVKER